MAAGKKEEPIEAEAEVIEEPTDQLVVRFSPASIEANFAALDAYVDGLLAPYSDASYDLTTPEAIKLAKNDRKYLNGLFKDIDERRKAVKREYSRPLDEFDARVGAITVKIKAASDRIKRELDGAEEARRAQKYAELAEHYEGFAGLLAPVVPYSRLHEDRWLNKTYRMDKACDELDAKVEKVAADWETLKAQGDMPHYELAEREFFRTLDLGAALNAARAAAEEDERIAELKQAMEPAEQAPERGDAVPVVMEGGTNHGTTEEVYADEPVPPRPAEPAPVDPAPPAPVMESAPPAPVEEDAPRPWVMVIPAATRAQIMALARDARAYGITGEMKGGTLAQVYERSING